MKQSGKYKQIINSNQKDLELKYPFLKDAPIENVIIEDRGESFWIKQVSWKQSVALLDPTELVNSFFSDRDNREYYSEKIKEVV
jgi:hypothetical protein